MRAKCVKCGCTAKRACVEFDADGYGHACWWATPNECSACFFESMPPHLTSDTRINRGTLRGRRFIKVPQLAGMVARSR